MNLELLESRQTPIKEKNPLNTPQSDAQPWLIQLIEGRARLRPAELARVVSHVSQAPFASAPLEVDEPLWGGFWQFDVIGPGYTLPAIELALLRAVRLDEHWPPSTTPQQFEADLQQAAANPAAGVWSLSLVGEPCLVFAAPDSAQVVTVGWYCATTGRWHAGYRAPVAALRFKGAVIQRRPDFIPAAAPPPAPPDWLSTTLASASPPTRQAARLDAAILRRRLAGFASPQTSGD